MYNDTLDAFTWIGAGLPVLHTSLAGQQRIGIGTSAPEAKLHVLSNSYTGTGNLKLTETHNDYARITMANNVFPAYWDVAARTDTISGSALFNIFYSSTGDIVKVHGDREVEILGSMSMTDNLEFKNKFSGIQFSSVNGSSNGMISMFKSGTNNSTRMVIQHSPTNPDWGLKYNDTLDAFTWIGGGDPVLHTSLSGARRVGIGTDSPQAKLHLVEDGDLGSGQLMLTEDEFDYSRITLNNVINTNYWDLAARTDDNLANASFNIYHSDEGDILTVNARGRIGINDASPSYAVEINGNQSTRIINAYNTLPTTSNTTYNYGVRCGLSQAANTGFPRLYNFYGRSTDNDSYLSYGIYAYASGASSNNYGIYAYAPTSSGYAGYFSGNTYCTGAYQTSDPRFKSNMTPVDNGLSIVMQLRAYKYQFKRDDYEFMNLPEGDHFGVDASEIKEVLPDLVQSTFHAYDEAKSDTDEGQGMWFEAVNYTELIPVLISAIQEQQEQIEKQQKVIEALEKRVGELEE